METYRISSNATIFLKIFLPTAWITFFGLFTLAIWIADPSENPMGGNTLLKAIYTAVFLVFFLMMYFTIMNLKRIDMKDDGVYVSNYFKTYRYKYIDIENIDEKNFGLFTLGIIHLKQKGSLGKKLRFIISKVHYNDFINTHPELMSHLLKPT